MRKSFVYAAGLICLALSITNCQKEPVDQATPASEPNFELFALPVTTKTANDGLDTKWVAKDAINVFHAEAGTQTYTSDGQFTVKNTETGSFDGTVSGTLDADKSYDWYAFYPYSSYNKTPAGVSQSTFGYTTIGGVSQTQTGNDSRAHLAGESCPLYGISKNVPSDKAPSIAMNHLTSVIKVSVTNNSGENLTVSSVSFTGTTDIVGTYYINFAASPVAYKSSGDKYVSSTASLTVSNGEVLANGSSADFCIAIKPFTAKSGSTLKLAVNGYEKTVTLDNDITFTAGHIKPLNFNYDTSSRTATFNFADPASLGLTKPASGSGAEITESIINGGVTLSETDGSTKTRLWNKSGTCELRSYNGGTLSFSVEKGYVIKTITFAGNSIKAATADVGEYDNGTWLGESSSVTFSIGKDGLQINSVIIVYEKGIVLPSLTKPVITADVNSAKDGIDVVWSDVENAMKYVVSCTGQENVEVDAGVEIASFAGLTVGQEYTVTVTATADGYKSATSDEAKVTIPDPRTPLATPVVIALLENINSIAAMWDAVDGAKDYTVTCGEQTFTTAETEYTFTNLAYSTEYTVSVIANPSDETVNTKSAAGKSETVKTGANPDSEEILTTELTNANIVAAGTGSDGYKDWSFTDGNGYIYNAKCIKNYHSKATSSYHYIQIKKDAGYCIELPQMPGLIKSIEMTVSSANKPMDGGGNTSSLGFGTTNQYSEAVATGKDEKSIIIEVPEEKQSNKGYITSDGAVRIWDIKISYYSK